VGVHSWRAVRIVSIKADQYPVGAPRRRFLGQNYPLSPRLCRYFIVNPGILLVPYILLVQRAFSVGHGQIRDP